MFLTSAHDLPLLNVFSLREEGQLSCHTFSYPFGIRFPYLPSDRLGAKAVRRRSQAGAMARAQAIELKRSWTLRISALARAKRWQQGLQLFTLMPQAGFRMNSRHLGRVIPATPYKAIPI